MKKTCIKIEGNKERNLWLCIHKRTAPYGAHVLRRRMGEMAVWQQQMLCHSSLCVVALVEDHGMHMYTQKKNSGVWQLQGVKREKQISL